MKLLVAGGGTGGHLFPGLALAEEVKGRHPDNSVLFVGTARGLEARVVPQAGYPLELISVGPLKGQGFFGLLRGLLRLPWSFVQSLRILRRFNPDVVVGVGGYASGPILLAAWFLRIPTAVQEQNALAGITNRILGYFVDACFVSFDEARAGFPLHKTQLLGNPIRRVFLDNYLKQKQSEERFSLFITGGSQGAHMLNLRVADAVERLAPALGKNLRVLHQTGEKDREAIAARYEDLASSGAELTATAFVEDMAKAYAEADLLVCRAGATTIAELTVCKKPAVLVPFPFAADDHQTVNANSVVAAGAGLLIPEWELTGEGLAAQILSLAQDRERLKRMSRQSGLLGRPEAAREIAEVCVRLVARRRWWGEAAEVEDKESKERSKRRH
jgi:UDP-N-acetylglucosamine--N-acetylmuramyl-(pentapeptide) pyrophosphoryl-undecaprenol N-acetylglucosamine transferase